MASDMSLKVFLDDSASVKMADLRAFQNLRSFDQKLFLVRPFLLSRSYLLAISHFLLSP